MLIKKMLSYLIPYIFLSFVIGFYSNELLCQGFTIWSLAKVLVSIFMIVFFIIMHHFILKDKIKKESQKNN